MSNCSSWTLKAKRCLQNEKRDNKKLKMKITRLDTIEARPASLKEKKLAGQGGVELMVSDSSQKNATTNSSRK